MLNETHKEIRNIENKKDSDEYHSTRSKCFQKQHKKIPLPLSKIIRKSPSWIIVAAVITIGLLILFTISLTIHDVFAVRCVLMWGGFLGWH